MHRYTHTHRYEPNCTSGQPMDSHTALSCHLKNYDIVLLTHTHTHTHTHAHTHTPKHTHTHTHRNTHTNTQEHRHTQTHTRTHTHTHTSVHTKDNLSPAMLLLLLTAMSRVLWMTPCFQACSVLTIAVRPEATMPVAMPVAKVITNLASVCPVYLCSERAQAADVHCDCIVWGCVCVGVRVGVCEYVFVCSCVCACVGLARTIHHTPSALNGHTTAIQPEFSVPDICAKYTAFICV